MVLQPIQANLQRYSDNSYFENHSLSGKLFFNREGLHLYGFKPTDYPYTIIDKKRYPTTLPGRWREVSFASRYKDNDKLNHTFGFSYYHLADNYKVKENNILVSAKLDKQADLFKWDLPQTLGLNASLNFLNQRDSVNKINASVLCINPTISARLNEYSFKAGLIF